MAGDAVSLAERVRRWLGYELVRRTVLLGVEVALIVIIVVALEILAARHNLRFDLTPTKLYSLSPVTRQVLQALKQDVEMEVFYRRGDRQQYEELLSLMAKETPRLRYRLFDLDRTPGLAQRYGISNYGSTVVQRQGDRITIPSTDEERVLNAILRLSQPVKTIYFVSGHGERDPRDMEERTGYGVVRRVLETEGYKVLFLLLPQTARVPEDADVVVVSGPKEEFSAPELEALSAYLSTGGHALFLIDPYTVPGLCRYLARFGFLLEDGVVVDTQTQLTGGDPLMPAIPTFATEVFPRQLRSSPMLPVVRPVAGQENGTRAFAFSSPASWLQRDRQRLEQGDLQYRAEEDQRGPIPVAAVAMGDNGSKVVVLGDSDFVDNFYCRIPGNVDFFMNTVGWLLGREGLISVGRTVQAPLVKRESTPAQNLYLSRTQARTFLWVLAVLEPGLVFLAGVILFFYRRKRE